ncbi:MAG: hypothetical protein B7Z66_11015 [Chromatiales bacterium 21-64-14]|nr:MAG: hypothetical protein B7Z66_11015 [Chromatiales bacterium 21-64-14]HQU17261.1 hypothetical protein [Gammaproteobacteria bacterium]
MALGSKATQVHLFSLNTIQMRTFHITWFVFFLCLFGCSGIATLMPVVRSDLGLTAVIVTAFFATLVCFSPATLAEEQRALEAALAERETTLARA